MGTKNLEYSPYHPAIQDLKVSIQESGFIFSSQKNYDDDEISIFLSNIDQVLNFHVQTVHFFPATPDFPPELVVARLKKALTKVMVHYDFLDGRLKMNQETGRLEIERNGSGVGFVVASTELLLDEIGDLVYPNPAFMQLIIDGLNKFDDQPLCVIQVTSFKCGGFALGLSTNHVLFDGTSFKTFLLNLASQCFHDKPFPDLPFNDRNLLAARSPPQVTFEHRELLKLKLPISDEPSPVFDSTQQPLDFKIFSLTSTDLNHLKKKALTAKKITGFNVVTAHIWRCKALSFNYEQNRDRTSVVLYAVDIRHRLQPPLPNSYCGNAVLTAYASAKCAYLEDEPFHKIVDLVTDGAARMTNEYARSAIDWGEVYKGFPNGEFLISSWWRLGFDQVVYPWGKSKYSCPVVCHRRDIILLFPEIGGAGSNGVNVLVALPGKEMEKFHTLFYELLK